MTEYTEVCYTVHRQPRGGAKKRKVNAMANTYYIAKIRSFFGREELSIVTDESGHMMEFASSMDARIAADRMELDTYVLASGEYARPELLVVSDKVIAWLDMDDDSKYDWDGCPCRTAAGQPCGLCDACTEYRAEQDIAYVRANAEGSTR